MSNLQVGDQNGGKAATASVRISNLSRCFDSLVDRILCRLLDCDQDEEQDE